MRVRCPAGSGSAAEALRPLWADAASDEDPAGEVHPAAVQGPAERTGPLVATGHVRPAGLHPLLGPFAPRQLDCEA